MPKARGTGLLEHLAELTGCDYLSDLGNARYACGLRRALEQTPLASYGEEWREAARYILHREAPGDGGAQRDLVRLSVGPRGSPPVGLCWIWRGRTHDNRPAG